MGKAGAFFEELLGKADVKLNGSRPWDIQVHDERLFDRVVSHGSLGLGEAYMDSWWDAEALDEFFHKILSAHLDREVRISPALVCFFLRTRLLNMQSRSRAFHIGEAHYDLGKDLYEAMLDKRMVYSCGYWSDSSKPKTLDKAQEAKLDLICRKIGLKKDDRILDIGCGWGSFAKYAAEKYGASVVGTTVSVEQATLARERCKGLPVEIRVQDYRDMNSSTMLGTSETFDHIVSVGMFEHVGPRNYRTYFEIARRCLKDDGLFLLHTIGRNNSVPAADPWIDKYIFPGGVLPSVTQIARAVERLFVMEDWQNFGPDYDKTLLAWFANFEKAWPELRATYGERFYRMWKYYLLSCAGNFRARNIQLWQVVLSKEGVKGGYKSIR